MSDPYTLHRFDPFSTYLAKPASREFLCCRFSEDDVYLNLQCF